MKNWTYSNEGGTRFDVQPGDVWLAGPHVLVCGDLERGDHMKLLHVVDQPAMAYIDPPWGSALARGFRTKAGVDGGPGHRVDFGVLLSLIIQAVKHCSGHAFLEIGRLQEKVLRDAISAGGGRVLDRWDTTYYKRYPCVLIHAGWAPGLRPATTSADGMDDAHTPLWAIEQFSNTGDTVLDVCAGRGLTAISCEAAGRRFVGLELSSYRASVTLTKLEALGHAPNRAGRLDTYKGVQ